MENAPLLLAENINAGYKGRPVLKGVGFSADKGQMIGVVGPNGAGKTTLLRALTGVVSLTSGRVLLQGRDIRRWSRQLMAQHMAVVPQMGDILFDFTVWDIVSMGRLAHQSIWSGETEADRAAVEQALEAMGLADFAGRSFWELSGGEQRRVIMARALAQEPKVLLLDEPTSHLDLGHQRTVMEYGVRLAREQDIAVVAVLHDLNTAALYCDHLVILFQGRVFAQGAPEKVLDADIIESVYGVSVEVVRHPRSSAPQVLITSGL